MKYRKLKFVVPIDQTSSYRRVYGVKQSVARETGHAEIMPDGSLFLHNALTGWFCKLEPHQFEQLREWLEAISSCQSESATMNARNRT